MHGRGQLVAPDDWIIVAAAVSVEAALTCIVSLGSCFLYAVSFFFTSSSAWEMVLCPQRWSLSGGGGGGGGEGWWCGSRACGRGRDRALVGAITESIGAKSERAARRRGCRGVDARHRLGSKGAKPRQRHMQQPTMSAHRDCGQRRQRHQQRERPPRPHRPPAAQPSHRCAAVGASLKARRSTAILRVEAPLSLGSRIRGPRFRG
jgi:hypothetical protein